MGSSNSFCCNLVSQQPDNNMEKAEYIIYSEPWMNINTDEELETQKSDLNSFSPHKSRLKKEIYLRM